MRVVISPPQDFSQALQGWHVTDFKSIADASVRIARLSVLAGANSSGKSSLLQSLLFLGQSTQEETPVLNGPLVRLGEPSDIIRNGQDSFSVGIGAVMDSDKPESGAVKVAFELRLERIGRELIPASLDIVVDGSDTLVAATKSRMRREDCENIAALTSSSTLLRVTTLQGRRAPAHTYISFQGLMPDALVYKQNPEQVRAGYRQQYRRREVEQDSELGMRLVAELTEFSRYVMKMELDVGSKELESFLRILRSRPFRQGLRALRELTHDNYALLLDHLGSWVAAAEWVAIPLSRYYLGRGRSSAAIRSAVSSSPLGVNHRFSQATAVTALVTILLRRLANSIKYLGPLREEPQVLASARGVRSRALPVGARGELTADLLARDRSEMVDFYDWDGKRLHLPLAAAVSLWVRYLGIGDRVSVLDEGKLGQGIRVEVEGIERDLTTIGVGASQLLPVVVAVLAVDGGSLLLIEQPELHLHPAVQSRLADFFLRARPDIRIIVETHSEYLVTRIRRRVAERVVSVEDIDILFAEQTGGSTEIRSLRLDKLGNIDEWPEGFFDTQDEESRYLVKAVRRQLMESHG